MACASAPSVMSSVASVGTLNGAARATQATPAYNVLFSSRRASSLCGVSVPVASRRTFSVRTESSRTLTVVAAKATNEPEAAVEEANAALEDVLKTVQESWEKTDDKPAIATLGAAGLIALWASFALVNAIERLPLIPDFFEIVGILFSGWFVYRYLLFKPDRQELVKLIDEAKARITETSARVRKDM